MSIAQELPYQVWKQGAMTGQTEGTLIPGIEAIVADDKYSYPEVYRIQGGDEVFAKKGDSGSIVFTEDSDFPVGMIVAVDEEQSVAYCVSLEDIMIELNLIAP